MKITEFCVKKPIAVIMVVLLIVVLGVSAYLKLGADLLPSMNTPVITISTVYGGAGTEEIENDIVKPVEDAVSGISGIDKLNSGSSEGYGSTTITFKMGVDMNTAFLDVQQALGKVVLPTDAQKPVISKLDGNAAPIMMFSVSSTLPYSKLYDSADVIKKSLEKVEGVGTVTLEGAYNKELIVNVDKVLLDKYGIAINTITSKLKSENSNIPAGLFKQGDSNQSIRVLAQFKDIKDAQNIQIPMANGGTIRLGEIADVKLDYPDKTELVRLNGKGSIGIFVQKQSDANIVKTANAVKKQLEVLKESLPKQTTLEITTDSSSFINSSLKEVKSGLVEGIITTILVMFLFLRSTKSSLIIFIAIPTSLIGTVLMMSLFGFTLNMLSLLALSLCIGILVDDSVVVLENIQRHINLGTPLRQAVLDGRNEISMAAISITLCDVVVFGPISFMSGMMGQLFKQFGLTVVFAALISLLVSFTLTPMLASKLLKEKENNSEVELRDKKINKEGIVYKIKGIVDNITDKFYSFYKKYLIFALNHRWQVVSVVLLLLVCSIALIPLKFIKTEFATATDQSAFKINIKLRADSDVKLTNDKVKEIEQHLKTIKEVNNYFTVVGNGNNEASAQINVNLVGKGSRKKGQAQIASETREWSKRLTGIDISVDETSAMGSPGKPIAINITGADKEVLKQLSIKVQNAIQEVPGIIDVSNNIQANQNQIAVEIDRIATAKYGIAPSEIAKALSATTVKGVDGGVFRENGDEYDVVVKLAKDQIVTMADLSTIKVANSAGLQFSLDQLAKIYMSDSPQQTLRLNRKEMGTISANIQGRPLGSITPEVEKKVSEITMPTNYELDYGGDQKQMNDSFVSLILAMALSVMLVYMILVVLYESFLTPLLRMLSLPCGLIGALIGLAITGNALNIVSIIGLIMLDGLSAKSGTLLIDYTMTLMKTGMPLREALLESGITRLRPILMTTATMIVGMLPSALATAEGSEFRVGMAVALIGGMITSTLISPVIIPVVYTLMDDLNEKFFSKKKKRSNKKDEGVTL
ncbi:efflux RND transporter permease subunit [Clostridium estertheticum]|uniref:efflux RND transporter permease subunit n=1 Tax=Clostridium estertheticum TaxID=238834 RepID=UPI001C0E89E8|nr:efflux RND transporter permease subunit [Clostridium estertheticum]MBU3202392.1 efflux RND transporter permease subunit [Clostridium estertheticum]WAG65479.1 efflux RND transporter permease subunit [Clostridium estertheticum]